MDIKNYTRMLLVSAFFLLSGSLVWAFQTDQGIESSISNSYVFNNYLKGDNIVVHSNEGVVTLTGTVADDNHKFLAQNTAENFPDVKSVDNQLQVTQPLPAEYSDAWVGLKVKAALLFHRNVSAVNTRVDVKDGIVTLSGDADNQAQKELATEYARDINGVKEVYNNMSIRPTGQGNGEKMDSTIDDASIAAQVKLTLLVHRSTSAIRTHVHVQGGVVTLTGTAANDAEKSLVSKLVSDIDGVKNIINNMDIKP